MSTAAVLEVESTSSPDKTYRVWVGPDGPIFCECPNHKFQAGKPAGQRKPCKHMRAITGETLIIASTLAREPLRAQSKAGWAPQRQTVERHVRFIEIVEMDNDNPRQSAPIIGLARFNQLEVQ